jgi:hypothetical protein
MNLHYTHLGKRGRALKVVTSKKIQKRIRKKPNVVPWLGTLTQYKTKMKEMNNDEDTD